MVQSYVTFGVTAILCKVLNYCSIFVRRPLKYCTLLCNFWIIVQSKVDLNRFQAV